MKIKNYKYLSLLILLINLSACDSDELRNEHSANKATAIKKKAKLQCQSGSDYMRQGVIGRFLMREAKKILAENQIKNFQKKLGKINNGYGRDGTNDIETCKLLVSVYKEIDHAIEIIPTSDIKKPVAVICDSTTEVNKYKSNSDNVARYSLMALNANKQALGFLEKHKKIASDFDNKKITPQEACNQFINLTNKVSQTVLDTRE